ncbi:MAG: radical SAM protein, partial [Burkholderia vietnamiensis]|nr:radical SAM protein [Burkholderia vietnamiensis]
AGVPVGVSIAPMIPFVTEPDMERVLEACADAGATHASYIVLRLPWEVAPLFKNWLAAHFPDRAERVMNRVRDMRGGKEYDSDFSKRMKGEGIWADLLRQRFRQAVKRLGLNERGNGILDMSRFRAAAPARVSAQLAASRAKPRDDTQLSLF